MWAALPRERCFCQLQAQLGPAPSTAGTGSGLPRDRLSAGGTRRHGRWAEPCSGPSLRDCRALWGAGAQPAGCRLHGPARLRLPAFGGRGPTQGIPAVPKRTPDGPMQDTATARLLQPCQSSCDVLTAPSPTMPKAPQDMPNPQLNGE